jgi:hypothetical protein
VGGPACKNKKVQKLFKENGSVEPWIVDPMAAAAVDRAVNQAHGSTVDRSQAVTPVLI